MSSELAQLPDHTGKFVFIEHSDSKNSYYNGEYFCTRQTRATLYATKAVVGHGGHEMKSFNLIGVDSVRVIEAWEDDKTVNEFVANQLAWADQIKDPAFKRQWIESVYTNARENALSVRRAIERRLSASAPTPLDAFVVTVPAGIRQLIINIQK